VCRCRRAEMNSPRSRGIAERTRWNNQRCSAVNEAANALSEPVLAGSAAAITDAATERLLRNRTTTFVLVRVGDENVAAFGIPNPSRDSRVLPSVT
jgi:hypothetical protein